MRTTGAPQGSSLVERYGHLADRAQRARPGATPAGHDFQARRQDIAQLKDFYLKRLGQAGGGTAAASSAPSAATTASSSATSVAAARATIDAKSRPTVDRPTIAGLGGEAPQELEVWCNNTFTFVPASQVGQHGQDWGQGMVRTEMAPGAVGLLHLKLTKLRGALELRLRSSNAKVDVMRCLSQLRYHIDTALKWTAESPEVGALTEHTLQQVKHLTLTARHIAPAVFVFAKRVENVIIQLEKELRRAGQGHGPGPDDARGVDLSLVVGKSADDDQTSAVDMNSIVQADSDTGTQYAETQVTEDVGAKADVADLQGANEALTLKDEDEQRRWFYSQCLTAKLQVQDKSRMRKVLISDLYVKVKAEQVPVEKWMAWIQKHLAGEEDEAPAPANGAPAPGPAAPAPATLAGYPSGAVPAYGGYPTAAGRTPAPARPGSLTAAPPSAGKAAGKGEVPGPVGPGGYRSLAQAWGTVLPGQGPRSPGPQPSAPTRSTGSLGYGLRR